MDSPFELQSVHTHCRPALHQSNCITCGSVEEGHGIGAQVLANLKARKVEPMIQFRLLFNNVNLNHVFAKTVLAENSDPQTSDTERPVNLNF